MWTKFYIILFILMVVSWVTAHYVLELIGWFVDRIRYNYDKTKRKLKKKWKRIKD